MKLRHEFYVINEMKKGMEIRMNKYLRAIGFSKCRTKEDINTLYELAYKKADDYQAYVEDGRDVLFSLVKEFGEGMGLCWMGVMRGKCAEYEYCIPYVEGSEYAYRENISVEERIFGNSYSGAFEDIRAGVFIIFCLQNGLDYVEYMAKHDALSRYTAVSLSGLSLEGTILLPLAFTEQEIKQKKDEQKKRIKLLNAAKNGDEKAMESLAYQDMNLYTKVSRRIMSEDVFSIVESSFMPYGIECDQYSLLADIVRADRVQNSYTKEYVWRLKLSYNGIGIDVCIHEEDLLGEPAPGRRFKGSLWLQGRIKV